MAACGLPCTFSASPEDFSEGAISPDRPWATSSLVFRMVSALKRFPKYTCIHRGGGQSEMLWNKRWDESLQSCEPNHQKYSPYGARNTPPPP